MRRVLLHAGMHKTGTTSIQKSLSGFEDARLRYFADPGGRSNHGRALFTLLGTVGEDRPRPGGMGGKRRQKEERASLLRALDESLSSLGERSLLLSAEGLMFLSAPELRQLAQLFAERSCEVGIIAYVRPPSGYITSMVAQRIKGGSVRALELDQEACDYAHNFGKFDEVFGRANVRLWKFDPLKFTAGCVVQDFCARLGIDLPAHSITRANESLSREAAGLLLAYRRHSPRALSGAENRALVDQLMTLGHKRLRFAPEIMLPVLERHAADIRWMEERLGEPLTEDAALAREGDVRNEADLLRPDAEAVGALLELLGARAPRGVHGRTPEEVARLVQALREPAAQPAARCIVHVGMHKTGTSSIQQSLQGWANERFLYADLNAHPNHSRALSEVLDFEFDRDLRRKPGWQGRSSALAERLASSIGSARGRTYLISGEGLSLASEAELERLRDYLAASFSEITIAAAVRPPAAYMASAFQEPLKRGGRIRLELPRLYRNYRRTFEKFDRVFGPANVVLWKFEPKSFPAECAVRDFCERFGIDLPAARIVRVNESLSREAAAALFAYRRFGQELGSATMSGAQNAWLVQRLLDLGRTKLRFAPSAVQPVLDANREDIEWMEQRLGKSLAEELGADRPADVRDENDLLQPDPEALRELRARAGARGERITGDTPRDMALLVHALRENAGAAAPAPVDDCQPGEAAMTVTQLIAELKKTNPGLLEGISDDKAEALVKCVFQQMSRALAEADPGVLTYAGLGRFRVRDAAEAGSPAVKRIAFRPGGGGEAGERGGDADARKERRARRAARKGQAA